MLTIRCAACKRKLWKYNKLGKGEVLRCHKARIERMIEAVVEKDLVACRCGTVVGLDKGTYYKMIRKSFIYSGAKVSKL